MWWKRVFGRTSPPEEVGQTLETSARQSSETAWVRMPKGKPPPGGWPVVVFLHGSGEHGRAYVVHAELAAENGFAGIAVSGPIATGGGGRAWSDDSGAPDIEIKSQMLPPGWKEGARLASARTDSKSAISSDCRRRWKECSFGAINLFERRTALSNKRIST